MATILVADDNRANREALAALLELAGHDVIRAADGREALARAREAHPELVISDVLMPVMDGYELARNLRADPGTAKAAVMFYTAYFGGQDAQALAQAHGVSRVLRQAVGQRRNPARGERRARLAPRGPGRRRAPTSTRSTCA